MFKKDCQLLTFGPIPSVFHPVWKIVVVFTAGSEFVISTSGVVYIGIVCLEQQLLSSAVPNRKQGQRESSRYVPVGLAKKRP